MKRAKIEDVTSAIEYIRSILKEWDAWKTHHTSLVEALEILLFSYEFKSKTLNEMSEYIIELHKKMKSFEGANTVR